jgi:hypothetical protein
MWLRSVCRAGVNTQRTTLFRLARLYDRQMEKFTVTVKVENLVRVENLMDKFVESCVLCGRSSRQVRQTVPVRHGVLILRTAE